MTSKKMVAGLMATVSALSMHSAMAQSTMTMSTTTTSTMTMSTMAMSTMTTSTTDALGSTQPDQISLPTPSAQLPPGSLPASSATGTVSSIVNSALLAESASSDNNSSSTFSDATGSSSFVQLPSDTSLSAPSLPVLSQPEPTTPASSQPPMSTSVINAWNSIGVITTLSPPPPAPALPAAVPVGYPLGCWLENSTPGRVLQDEFLGDVNYMTPAVCAEMCKNYTLFGLEYGTQCLCGNEITPGRAIPSTNNDCQLPCSGDASQFCGGVGSIYVYQSLPPPPPPPAGLFSNISFTPGGCLAEGPDGARALNGYLRSYPSMTPSLCAGVCGMSNFMFFGVEYGNECWCGNDITPGAKFVDSSKCNLPCAGDKTTNCGGQLAMSLWNGTYNNIAGFTVSTQMLTPGLDGDRFGDKMALRDGL